MLIIAARMLWSPFSVLKLQHTDDEFCHLQRTLTSVWYHAELSTLRSLFYNYTCNSYAKVRQHDITPVIAWPGRRRASQRLGNDQWASGAASIVSSCVVCHNGWRLTTERRACLIFVYLPRRLVSSACSQWQTLPCWWRHARCELQMMIDWGATYILSCLSAMTR